MFLFAPPPYPRDRTASNNSPSPWVPRAGLVLGVALEQRELNHALAALNTRSRFDGVKHFLENWKLHSQSANKFSRNAKTAVLDSYT